MRAPTYATGPSPVPAAVLYGSSTPSKMSSQGCITGFLARNEENRQNIMRSPPGGPVGEDMQRLISAPRGEDKCMAMKGVISAR
jgi:hypothetical protein